MNIPSEEFGSFRIRDDEALIHCPCGERVWHGKEAADKCCTPDEDPSKEWKP